MASTKITDGDATEEQLIWQENAVEMAKQAATLAA